MKILYILLLIPFFSIPAFAIQPYDYIVYSDGTTKAFNTMTETVDFEQGNGKSADVIQYAINNGDSILIKNGFYKIDHGLDLDQHSDIIMENYVRLAVSNGYTGYVFKISDGNKDSKITGGQLWEQNADGDKHLWKGIVLESNANAVGISHNIISNVQINDAGVGIYLNSLHPNGWIIGNHFEDIDFYNNVVAVEFGDTGKIRKNLFEAMRIQTTDIAETGIKNVRDLQNNFIGSTLWDLDYNNKLSMNILPSGDRTVILGGMLTTSIDDKGQNTIIVDPDNIKLPNFRIAKANVLK
jgi:hypothetical protein